MELGPGPPCLAGVWHRALCVPRDRLVLASGTSIRRSPRSHETLTGQL